MIYYFDSMKTFPIPVMPLVTTIKLECIFIQSQGPLG